MLIGPNFIYLELLKTASSHTRKVLESIPELDLKSIGKHTTLHDLRADDQWTEKAIIGNVRNPWDWYVSHWAFGCMQRGGLYKRLKNHSLRRFFKSPLFVLKYFSRFYKNHGIYKNAYSDAHDRDGFKRWLDFVLHHPTMDVERGYASQGVYKNIGLYGYEYLKMYSHPDQPIRIDYPDDARELFYHHHVLTHTIRSEYLIQDLKSIARALDIGNVENALAMLPEKTNTSNHKPFIQYYDNESMDWVAEKEKLIIEKYGYTIEPL